MTDDQIHTAIVVLLRVGVALSTAVILTGTVVTFVHHPEYFRSRPALGALTSPGTHFPNTLPEVISGVRNGRGQALIMAGLLILIATPVARVALSIAMFVMARDRLYVAITAVVLIILLISLNIGLAAG